MWNFCVYVSPCQGLPLGMPVEIVGQGYALIRAAYFRCSVLLVGLTSNIYVIDHRQGNVCE